MLARSLVRKVPTCLKGRNLPVSRTVATNRASRNQNIRPLIVRSSEIPSASLKRKAPACGWRKTIVSSSSSSSSLAAAAADQTVDHDNTGTTSTEKKPAETITVKLEGLGEGFEKLEVDMAELHNLASMRCTPLSLKDMYKYAVDFSDQEQRLRNAQFLHKELPIRIAQRAVDLLNLPHGLSEAFPVQQIAHMYLSFLEKFQEFPLPTTPDEEHEFTDLLQQIVSNRASIPKAIARGIDVWRKTHAPEELQEVERMQQMEEALYRFFTARVGLRFLTEHHIMTSSHHASRSLLQKSNPSLAENDGILGCIQTDCDPVREIENVVDTVTLHTQELFGVCPEIQIVDASQDENSKFTYVPHHLQYMVGELLKNSCRATVKKYLESEANGETIQMPQIRVVVVKGKEDVTIKVADRGGGIPRSQMSNILRFAQSTAEEKESSFEFASDEVCGTKLRGFGLPLARIYARYFGGELTLKSMEGYGLDAYLQLPRLGDSCENLPLPVKFSPGELNSNPPRRVAGAL
mmetsp:Transcript_2323/g.5280  ORF Transcript_2323/g.5280 Transcript_2323/m.5280 type:complete len:520 (+) Transcript_2323:258-1817(+)